MPWGNFNSPVPTDYVVPGNPAEAGPPNIFMEGVQPTFPWHAVDGSADRTGSTYEVLDEEGAVIETGSAAASPLVLAGDYPAGGYTLHVKRATPDATWGLCQGVTYFVVWRPSAVLRDVADLDGVHYQALNHLDVQPRLRGATGLSTVRLTVEKPYDPDDPGSYGNLASIEPAVELFDAWKPTDAARPMKTFLAFPYWRDGIVLRTFDATGGTFTVTVGGQVATIAYNASVSTILAAIAALPTVGAGHVTGGEISGSGTVDTGFIEVWFWGPLNADVDAGDVTCSGAGLTGLGAALSVQYDRDGVADVVAATAGLVDYYEPNNEPNAGIQGFNTAAKYLPVQKAFHGVVKAVDPTKKVLGPCTIEVSVGSYTWLEDFFDLGGDDYLDELSVHDYNGTNGDLVLARQVWDRFAALLATHSITKPVWMTEWGNFAWHYGLYQPRHLARWIMTAYLVWEQYGIPKERVNYFYDMAHGFLSYPSQVCAGGGQMNPAPVVNVLRIYADELHGFTHLSRLDFGDDGPYTIGSLFAGSGGTHLLVMASNGRTDHVVTLNVSGAATLAVISPQGASSTVGVSGGQAQVALSNGIPCYVRLPAGVTALPATPSYGTDLALSATTTGTGSGAGRGKVNDGVLRTWYFESTGDRYEGANAPFLDDTVASSRSQASVATTDASDVVVVPPGSVVAGEVGDGIVHANLPPNTTIRRVEDSTTIQVSQTATATGSATATITRGLPATVGLQWGSAQTFNRVVVWCPPPWQGQGTLLDFDLQYHDGSGWVTIEAVTEPTRTVAWLSDGGLGNNWGGGGSQAESYFSDRCVFVFEFAAVTASQVRLYVRDCTIGGWPDADCAAAGGQGGVQRVNIRSFSAFNDAGGGPDTTPPTVVARTVNASTLVLTYGEPLDPAFSPTTSQYTVKVASVQRPVTAVVVSGSTVTLTLSAPVGAGQVVTVSYAP